VEWCVVYLSLVVADLACILFLAEVQVEDYFWRKWMAHLFQSQPSILQ
jgi:hypothetical protein